MATTEKKIVLAKASGSSINYYYPKTTADNVFMNSGNTVQATIGTDTTSGTALYRITQVENTIGSNTKSGSALYRITQLENTVGANDTAGLRKRIADLETEVANMKDKLDFDTIYMKNSNGVLLTDGDGNNLVAVY